MRDTVIFVFYKVSFLPVKSGMETGGRSQCTGPLGSAENKGMPTYDHEVGRRTLTGGLPRNRAGRCWVGVDGAMDRRPGAVLGVRMRCGCGSHQAPTSPLLSMV